MESTQLNLRTFSVNDSEYTINILHKKVPLNLRTSFGTSHSSTKIRYNSFVQVTLTEKNIAYTGLGESGLPPKKPGCYLADTEDIKNYINEYFNHLQSLIDKYQDTLKILKADYIKQLNEELPGLTPNDIPDSVLLLFYCLDTSPANKELYSKASKNCIEGAILDLLGKYIKKNVKELFNIKLNEKDILYTFYTVGINEDDEMKKSLEFGLEYTRHIKIKLNKDFKKSEHSLKLLDDECTRHDNDYGTRIVWSIDLNSDFEDPLECIEFTKQIILNYKERIYMIEQPFPINFEEKIKPRLDDWKAFKKLCEDNNILVYADESVTNVSSVEPLKEIISGINIKIEKCGGIREAMKCEKMAKKLGLKVWIGTMVGSCLAMNMCATVVPLAVYSDMDGGLLLTEESQPGKGGFIWDKKKGCIVLSHEPGLGVVLKKENSL